MVGGMLGRIGRRDVFAMAVLVLVGVGIPLALAGAAGAIGLPSNDDWVYMRGAESLYRTGTVEIPGHYAALIGQLVMVQPLLWLSGGDPWAFTAFGLLMALLGIVSAYLLARRFVGTGSAVMVVLLILVFPGFSRESATFMTDGPAYALAMLSLLLGTCWLQGEGGRAMLVASVGIGLIAVSIREFAIAAPIAILLAAWFRAGHGERAFLASMSGLLVVGTIALVLSTGATPGRGAPSEAALHKLSLLRPTVATFAAVLLPAAVLATGRRVAGLKPLLLIVAAGMACLVAQLPTGPILGNLWERSGLGGNLQLTGIREPVIVSSLWILSEQLAVFATFLVAALALHRSRRVIGRASSLAAVKVRIVNLSRSREAPLLLFLAIYGAEVAAYSLLNDPFDRYLFPMIPVAAILLLREPARAPRLGRSNALSHAAFAWLAVSAIIIAANSFAYDVARWREGEALVAAGYDARTIDAGYEWVGYHSAAQGAPDPPAQKTNWYYHVLSAEPPCAVVSNSALDVAGLSQVSVNTSAYRQYLFLGPDQPFYLYSVANPGCPTPPTASDD